MNEANESNLVEIIVYISLLIQKDTLRILLDSPSVFMNEANEFILLQINGYFSPHSKRYATDTL